MVALYRIRHTIIFLPCGFFLSFFLFSSPNLSRRRLDVCHTSTYGVALLISRPAEGRRLSWPAGGGLVKYCGGLPARRRLPILQYTSRNRARDHRLSQTQRSTEAPRGSLFEPAVKPDNEVGDNDATADVAGNLVGD